MKKILYIVSFSFCFTVSYNSFAGFGDNTNATQEEEQGEGTEKTNTTDFSTDGNFSKESFSSQDGIMDAGDGDGPPPMPDIPLDGGASLLLLGGISLGIKKLFGKKK